MRRIVLLAAGSLLLAGCNWTNNWHWPRRYDTGSTATRTLVYFQNEVIGYQGPLVSWAGSVWTQSGVVTIRLVEQCPTGRNCVIWKTAEVSPYAGTTGVAFGTGSHILAATVKLDPDVGRVGTVTGNRYIACHEAGHALGGALYGDAHIMCDQATGYPTAHDYAEIRRVYNHHG